MARDFHLGDILSVVTERLVSPDHIDGVYRILNYMTGDNLFTHQLPRANRECAPALLAQHPQLNAVQVPDDFGPDPKTAVDAWLAEQVATYGETLPVEPLAAGDHTRINPIDELAMIKGGDRSGIIVVHLDEHEGERP